ncbi:TetR/AcrR family transcriptional regulator [Cupriavidus numazuensis]|uniref:HTH-type transcriptional repressor ComR n=1 Tax=Cupriavidus numazuensis TaxID=221992 RepID=A0ABN7Q7F5_9BURK|nr:TetR/AcrR family transcriptional regulator [Cupriavidus numazuensis]CAG2156015.1 HTH-type transcriptional repressor ComR [Cupriavidus numazuensis]
MARPRKFDEQTALTAAQDAFWARGYEATSTRDLTSAMGMTQPSLYNAFGDKRSLFLQALDFYLDHNLRERIARLSKLPSPAAAISAFFAESIARSLADPEHRGCLLVNTALEVTPQEPELRQKVSEEFERMRNFFRDSLVAAQASGEIPAAGPVEDNASQLLALVLGVRVLARTAPDPQLLESVVRPALASLGLPPLPLAPATAGTG